MGFLFFCSCGVHIENFLQIDWCCLCLSTVPPCTADVALRFIEISFMKKKNSTSMRWHDLPDFDEQTSSCSCANGRIRSRFFLFFCLSILKLPWLFLVANPGRLRRSVTMAQLQHACQEYGPVKEVRVLRYRSGAPKGNACVTMLRDRDAKAAEAGLNGSTQLGFPWLVVARTTNAIQQMKSNSKNDNRKVGTIQRNGSRTPSRCSVLDNHELSETTAGSSSSDDMQEENRCEDPRLPQYRNDHLSQSSIPASFPPPPPPPPKREKMDHRTGANIPLKEKPYSKGSVHAGKDRGVKAQVMVGRSMDNTNANGQKLKESGSTIFVRPLPEHMDELQLCSMFSVFGPILAAKILRRANGASRGDGFVQFVHPTDAKKALGFDGKKFGFDGKFLGILQAKRPLIDSIMRGNGGVYSMEWLAYLHPGLRDRPGAGGETPPQNPTVWQHGKLSDSHEYGSAQEKVRTSIINDGLDGGASLRREQSNKNASSDSLKQQHHRTIPIMPGVPMLPHPFSWSHYHVPGSCYAAVPTLMTACGAINSSNPTPSMPMPQIVPSSIMEGVPQMCPSSVFLWIPRLS